MDEGIGDRDEPDRLSWSQLLAEAARWLVLRLDDPPPEPEQGRRLRRRSGQSLTEYLIVVGLIAGVGFGAVTGLRAAMDTTVGKVTSKLEDLEFVREQQSAPPPAAPSGGVSGRALAVSSCEHPRVVAGACEVCGEVTY